MSLIGVKKMSFGSCIYQIVIYPLELIYEFIFSLTMQWIPVPGVAIIVLSIFINSLLLPIYQMIDSIQKEQREKEKDLQHWVNHIKKTFKGDERFLILQTYYRQNNYHPVYALKGALPLVLEFPFFIAAYHFLSNLSLLKGYPFLFIKDLSIPDQLISIAGNQINVLPFVMTLINIISGAIYMRDLSVSNKIQTFVMAIVFLVLLYNSPSGMVLYWTLNNIFALLKNIIYSYRKPLSCTTDGDTDKGKDTDKAGSLSLLGFILCECVIILLMGIVIPSGVIKASPLEFVDVTEQRNPIHFLKGSITLAFGLFGLWIPFFYCLAKNSKRKISLYMCIFSYISMIDYYFFATDMGYISANLKYDDYMYFTLKEIAVNAIVLAIIVLITILIYKYRDNILTYINFALVFVLTIISIINISSITADYNNADFSETVGEDMNIPLSRTGNNVVVIMLDRALSGCVPYIMNEKPELKKQFSGFTYYPNTISYGTNTAAASAAVFGGYEYTDVNSLSDKDIPGRNEALKLMPKLFSDNGYDVTIFDPPFANGQDIPDLSIYEGMQVRAFHASGKFHYSYDSDNSERRYRNFFCYSLCKGMPLAAQYSFYDDGYYNDVTFYMTNSLLYYMNDNENISQGISFNYSFENEFAELNNLSNITSISDEDTNTFFMGYNQATHEITILSEPDYVPALHVDNTEYDATHKNRFTIDGRTMHNDDYGQMYHYHVNMAALMQLGKWFDYLRANDVYDNTRIILVADHGFGVNHFDDMITKDGLDVESVNPLLMVKDFNAKEYTTDNTFMTNADVPVLACDDIIENPVNPYTGKAIQNDDIKKYPQIIPDIEYQVKDNIFDMNNWEKIK